jgi:hypothetical protein
MDKGIIVDSNEKNYIYEHSRAGECQNEQHVTNSNVSLELLLKYNTGRLALPGKYN